MAIKPARKSSASTASVDPITTLLSVARNLWWTWNPDAIALFDDANHDAFIKSDRNAIVALKKITPARRKQLAKDADFVKRTKAVATDLRRYLRAKTWYTQQHGRAKGNIAYFCMEYGMHESLPLYAGGLGVLAGDHLKSASDLGLPLVAVGIYWKRGYTRQHINRAGQQTDEFRTLSPDNTPFELLTQKSGKPLRLQVKTDRGVITAGAWRCDVGRIPLYLLDTDIPENAPRDRKLTHVLYSGDRDTRIRQEILLGVGGWQLLEALKIKVACCHLNEGHAAFCSLERIAEQMKSAGQTFMQATKTVADTTVFTTHTPVPAGNETFTTKLVDAYFKSMPKRLNMTAGELHDLARVKPGDEAEQFGMTPLALRTSKFANGVARLHGQTARKMWKPMFPKKKLASVPIGHVTNGIHLRTWMHPRMADLYASIFGDDWEDKQDVASTYKPIHRLEDAALWRLHQELKLDLVEFCRTHLGNQLRRSGAPGMKAADAAKILDPNALTIGFARRFATYKRAALIFSDPKRLAKILNNRAMPVQLIFAGKAHPADGEGKAVLKSVVEFSRMPRFRNRVVFLEDYEMNVARHMVAGVDVWLNNPQRPKEASGTSGMKPALHGGLNFSILDGWWPEGFNKKNGWAIGKAVDNNGTKQADTRDVTALYNTLEKEIVPLYYDRNTEGLPTKWIARMKNAIATITPQFNANRQVKEYLKHYYLPAMRKS